MSVARLESRTGFTSVIPKLLSCLRNDPLRCAPLVSYANHRRCVFGQKKGAAIRGAVGGLCARELT
jgi:hypothetical protein